MPKRSPSLVLVHAVWATSRRRPFLSQSLDERVLTIIGRQALELRCQLLAAGCASDHVHVVARLASSASLGELLRRMKGASAYELNHQLVLPEPFSWQAGYWAESLSPADHGLIVQYVRGQREHHDDAHPAERWANGDPDIPLLATTPVSKSLW